MKRLFHRKKEKQSATASSHGPVQYYSTLQYSPTNQNLAPSETKSVANHTNSFFKHHEPFQPTGPNHFDSLPRDITLSIFKYLTLKDLAHTSQTSRTMRWLAKQPALGLSKMQQTFLNKDFKTAFISFKANNLNLSELKQFIELGADVNSYNFLYELVELYTQLPVISSYPMYYQGNYDEKAKSRLFQAIMFFLDSGADIDKAVSPQHFNYSYTYANHANNLAAIDTPIKLAAYHKANYAEIYDLLCVYKDRKDEPTIEKGYTSITKRA